MVQDVSAPNLIVVIAVEAIPTGEVTSTLHRDFQRVTALFGELGSVITEPAGLSATIALEPDAEIPPSVAYFEHIVSDFEAHCAVGRMRALLHHGTAFRALSPAGEMVFQGSALRSASNSLRRAAPPAGIYASPDFIKFISVLKGVMGFKIVPDAHGQLGLLQFASHVSSGSSTLHSTDPDLIDWLRVRLAKDLGPFAVALIDNASHSARTAKELAAAVGHEIVNPHARQRFDADVFAYIESRSNSSSG